MTSDSTAITQKSLSKRALAIIVALLMALGTVFVTTLPAHADSNVTIDDVFLQNDTFADGTRQELHVQWSIPEAATPTVSLSLELPEFMRGYSDTFDMVDANGNAVGECVVTADAINCTVDDTFIINNPYGVSGEFWFDVQTELKNKEETQHTFDFGGFTQDVTIEANRNWCTTDCEFTGLRASKWGTYYNSDDTIIWSVRIPAPATGIEPGKAITVTDQLDDSIFELVTTDGYPRVRESSAIGYDDWDREVAYYKTKDAGEVSWSDDNLTASFTSAQVDYPGGVSEGQTLTDGSFYIVQWEVRVKDEGKAGKYSNDATYTIEGEDDGDMSGSATRYSGGATVVGTNFGRFQVAKELTGDTALNPTFTVDYEAFDDTVDPNVAIDSGSFEIKSGQSFVSDEYFKGTRIVLGEIKPTDPDNVIWEDPKFLDADGNEITELTFSAENGNLGQVTEIRLVNEANLIDSTITARKVVENPDSVTTGVNDFRVTVTRQPNIEKGITPLIGGQLLLPANGDVVSVDYPAGTGYGFFENFVPSPAGTTWADPVYTVNGVEYTEGEFVDLPLDGSIDLTVTNTITQNLGGFAVTKSVSGEGESLVPEGTEFVVNYSYTSVNGFDAGEGQVTVAAGARSLPIEDIPAGATVTLDEVRPVNPLGGTWGEPQFDVAEFTAINDQIIEISLDNPISWNDGDFSIVKTVEGDAADMVPADEAFVVDYTYTLPAELGIDPNTGEGQLTVQNDGTATTSDPLPYGTEVTLAEQTPAPIAGATWTGSAFSEQTFTIGDETTLAVTLTNSIERDLGSFSIVKSLSGTGESLVADDTVFTVNYSYPAGDGFEAGEGTVEVSADGTPVVVDGIPAGAVVTLNEATPADITGGTWSAPNFVDGNIVNVEKDATSEVELENIIELNTGYLAIEKRIDGTGAALATPDEVYTVSYSYPAGEGYEAGEGTLEIQADGEPVSTEPLPYGATVALSELTPVPVEGAAWTGAEFSTSSVVVGDGTTAEVILTNTLTEDVPEPTPTPTVTPDPTETPTPTPDPTETPEPSPSPTTDPTPVPTPTDDPEPTETPAPTPTDDPEPTPTPTDDPEPTETPEPTVTPEPTPTEDPTPDPSPAPAPEPTSDPEPTPTTEPSAAPSDDPDDSKLNPTGQDTTPLIAGAAFALLLAGAGIEIARRRSAARNS